MPETRKPSTANTAEHRAHRGVVFGNSWKVSAAVIAAGILIFSYGVWGNALRAVIPGSRTSQVQNSTDPKPVKISIPSLKLATAVTNLGLNADQTLQTPADANQVGWYTGSAAPGALGPAVMVGHLDTVFGPAIFSKLKNLEQGDRIQVTRDNGSVATFQVVDKQTYPQNNFPTDKVYGAINYAGLRLITCSGTYSRLAGHYSDNIVVYAALVSIN